MQIPSLPRHKEPFLLPAKAILLSLKAILLSLKAISTALGYNQGADYFPCRPQAVAGGGGRGGRRSSFLSWDLSYTSSTSQQRGPNLSSELQHPGITLRPESAQGHPGERPLLCPLPCVYCPLSLWASQPAPCHPVQRKFFHPSSTQSMRVFLTSLAALSDLCHPPSLDFLGSGCSGVAAAPPSAGRRAGMECQEHPDRCARAGNGPVQKNHVEL